MLNSRTQLAELRGNTHTISLEADFGRRPPSTDPSFSFGDRGNSTNAVRVDHETWVTVEESRSAGTVRYEYYYNLTGELISLSAEFWVPQ